MKRFAVPRKGAGIVLVVVAILFSLFTYYCRFIAPYRTGLLSNFGRALAWLAIAFVLGIAVTVHCIRERNLAVCLILVAACAIACILPVPRNPEKAWFLKHQAGYEQVLQLAEASELNPHPDYPNSKGLLVPDEYGKIQLELVRIEQASPALVEFASRRFVASVYYAADQKPDFPYELAGLHYQGELQLADHWWLVYTSYFP